MDMGTGKTLCLTKKLGSDSFFKKFSFLRIQIEILMLLNCLEVIAHARRMNMLFTIIDVLGACDEQLE
jgi:hypothetical protein